MAVVVKRKINKGEEVKELIFFVSEKRREEKVLFVCSCLHFVVCYDGRRLFNQSISEVHNLGFAYPQGYV